MMNRLKVVYAIVFIFLFLLISGCASPLRNYAQDVIDNYQTSIEKKILSRNTLINLRLMGLNKQLLEDKYNTEMVEKIETEIKKLHDEQRFLFTMNYEQFKLDYEIVEEYENKDGLRRLIIKVEGKTHNVNKDGFSEIIDIPEEASYWFFGEFEYNGKIQIAGPLAVPEKKLKELTEPKEKSSENESSEDFHVVE